MVGEALAARDPANVGWQVDLAVSCAKLGSAQRLDVGESRRYLERGLDILTGLKGQGRLMHNQFWTGWFEERLAALR
ncbi:MAG: hypothetical protein HY778_11270 [Betaproteobacteria bacterium]|nr:hypothetical protein [Betaproteobacteria bacterium]